MTGSKLKLIECPRDAMQGWKTPIPTATKIAYINSLLQVGFDTIDFGSFVSPKAIPQLADTDAVLKNLDLSDTPTKLLAIIANTRGAEDAVASEKITYLGFPLSVSQTFQQRNTNASIEDAMERVKKIQALCLQNNKELVVYISMAFGNPYGDVYNPEVVFDYASQLADEGIQIISLADTVGVATPEQVNSVTAYVVNALPATEIGVHLHSSVLAWREKIDAAFTAGCRRFDGALKGIGGCPMAHDDLVGNMNTEWLLDYFGEKESGLQISNPALEKSLRQAEQIFV